MSDRARRSPWLAGLVPCATALLFGACQQTGIQADTPDLSGGVSAISAMLEVARSAPPTRGVDGFVVRSFEAAAPAGPGWKTSSQPVSLEVDAHTAARTIHTAAHGSISARRLGPGTHETTIEGSALTERSDDGELVSVVLATGNGVEELLVQREATDEAGYELDLPVGWTLERPAGFPGMVAIRDGAARLRMRVVSNGAWDAEGARQPVSVELDGRRILYHLPEGIRRPAIIDPEWQDSGSPAQVRARATSTVLQDGRVLVMGGVTGNDELAGAGVEPLCTTEIYDPFLLVWEAGPPIQGEGEAACTPLMDHVAVPLTDGRVLVTGGASGERIGANQPAAVNKAYVFDPITRSFSRTGDMNAARVHHTATLLGSGAVLVAGGMDRLTPLLEGDADCPAVGDARCQRCVGTSTAELYDPASGSFTPLTMDGPRACHTATRIDDDTVLFIGGGGAPVPFGDNGETGTPVSTITLYRDGAFSQASTQLNSPRFGHVAVLRPDTSQILVALGRNLEGLIDSKQTGATPAEVIYLNDLLGSHPDATATAVDCVNGCPTGRAYGAGVLAHSGIAYLVGGQQGDEGTEPSSEVNIFDFDLLTFVLEAPQLLSPASKPALAPLATGEILLVGQTAPAQLLDDGSWSFPEAPAPLHMTQPRTHHRATPLPDGSVLLTGGYFQEQVTATAEVFDPSTGISTAVGSMSTPRSDHTATVLPDWRGLGTRVLVTGGVTGADSSLPCTETAELYDPATKTFGPAGSMSLGRAFHAAARLPDGEVLIEGGAGTGNLVLPPSSELYDPATDTFVPAATPSLARVHHSMTVLPTGNVLVAGGFAHLSGSIPTGDLTSAEIYDRTTDPPSFRSLTANLFVARGTHSATPLSDGRVLLLGGSAVTGFGELFDPSLETFTRTAHPMSAPRLGASAVALPSGKVLIAGGAPTYQQPASADAEIYDPASQAFTHIVPESGTEVHRWREGAALLPDGTVALFGGDDGSDEVLGLDSIEILSIRSAFTTPRADILTAPAFTTPGTGYAVTGTSLTSYHETSSGPYASPTGSPIAVWLPSTGAPLLGGFAPWSSLAVTYTPPSSPFAGDGFLFAARSGASGVGVPLKLDLAPDGIACVADVACESGFCSDGVCCNERCHVGGKDDAICRACSVALGAAKDGQCSLSSVDSDPHEDCGKTAQCADSLAVCGGNGSCRACVCTSNLDCAEGYVCTAGGTCEPPAELEGDDGCSVGSAASSWPDRRDIGLVALLLGFSRRFARRRRAAHSR